MQKPCAFCAEISGDERGPSVADIEMFFSCKGTFRIKMRSSSHLSLPVVYVMCVGDYVRICWRDGD